MQPRDDDALLTPSEVAAMFRVNPKTVTRWARAGKISAIRTLGGHRRFRASEIRQFLEQVRADRPAQSSTAVCEPQFTTVRRGDRPGSRSASLASFAAMSGRDRRRSGDPTLFRRVLCRLSYPAGMSASGRMRRPAVLTGFEPAASALTGRRALQTAPQDQ